MVDGVGMIYLQLVLAGLSLRGWVQEIDCENLISTCQPGIHFQDVASAFAVQFAGLEGILMQFVQSCASRPGRLATAHSEDSDVPFRRCCDANRFSVMFLGGFGEDW